MDPVPVYSQAQLTREGWATLTNSTDFVCKANLYPTLLIRDSGRHWKIGLKMEVNVASAYGTCSSGAIVTTKLFYIYGTSTYRLRLIFTVLIIPGSQPNVLMETIKIVCITSYKTRLCSKFVTSAESLANLSLLWPMLGFINRWKFRLHQYKLLHSHQKASMANFGKCAWWRHQMETFSALLAPWAGISTATGEFPAQRSVTRSFDVFFDLRLNKRLSK